MQRDYSGEIVIASFQKPYEHDSHKFIAEIKTGAAAGKKCKVNSCQPKKYRKDKRIIIAPYASNHRMRADLLTSDVPDNFDESRFWQTVLGIEWQHDPKIGFELPTYYDLKMPYILGNVTDILYMQDDSVHIVNRKKNLELPIESAISSFLGGFEEGSTLPIVVAFNKGTQQDIEKIIEQEGKKFLKLEPRT